MKTTLDIPDDLAGEVQRRARLEGRELGEQVVQLVRLGLRSAGDSVVGELQDIGQPLEPVAARAESTGVSTDPTTGLPVIDSPPDAPVRSMSAGQVQAIVDQALSEEPFERSGGSDTVRQ